MPPFPVAAAEKLKAASASSLEGAFLKEVNTEADKLIKELMNDINVGVAKVKAKHKNEVDAA